MNKRLCIVLIVAGLFIALGSIWVASYIHEVGDGQGAPRGRGGGIRSKVIQRSVTLLQRP